MACKIRMQSSDPIGDKHRSDMSSMQRMTQPNVGAHQIERRRKGRIMCDYPAIVKGTDGQGMNFSESGRVVNLSASGVYLMTRNSIQKYAEVSIRIALSTDQLLKDPSKLTTLGNVVRCEQKPDGKVGIAIMLREYKFF